MQVPKGMTMEVYTSNFIRLVQIARRFTGTHSWPGSEQLLSAYFRAVNRAWKAILGMTKSGTTLNFATVNGFFKSLETNKAMTGKRIADTLNPSVIQTPKKPRHADHRGGDAERHTGRNKGRGRRWGQDRSHGGGYQGKSHSRKKHHDRNYNSGGGRKYPGGGSYRGGGGSHRHNKSNRRGSYRRNKNGRQGRSRYKNERRGRGGPPCSNKGRHDK